MRDHGGNLDAAMARYGATQLPDQAWIDLSTGINRVPWGLPELPPLPAHAWTALPTAADMAALHAAARKAWGISGAVLALSGASQPIQLIPQLLARSPGPNAGQDAGPLRARVLGPTYNEHAAALRSAGWQVDEVDTLSALEGAALAVVVNPNNPDGRHTSPQALLALKRQCKVLIVDESFADPTPELSLAGATGPEGLWVLRSFGKFYGLAGLRLGFALGAPSEVAALAALAGPWPVSGPAIAIGAAALADTAWQQASSLRLQQDAARLDRAAPWPLVGGTTLFRLYNTPDAAASQAALAKAQIWSRIFPWHPGYIRLGLPSPEEWPRVEAALAQLSPPARGI